VNAFSNKSSSTISIAMLLLPFLKYIITASDTMTLQDDTSANSLFSTRCCCQRHSQSGLDEGYKQATMTTQPPSSNEQWATCFDWVIAFLACTGWFTHNHLVDC
jgi:hypothetical protein